MNQRHRQLSGGQCWDMIETWGSAWNCMERNNF